MERSSRGWYRARPAEEYSKSKNNIAAGYELLKNSGLPYALTGIDGVFVWTKGGYNAGRFFGSYPIYLKVSKSDLTKWKTFFAENGRKSVMIGEKPKETLFGVYYVLHPVKAIKARVVNGLKVEPLRNTVAFAKTKLHTFGPSLKMLKTSKS